MQIVGWKTYFQMLGLKLPEPEKNAGWKSDKMTDRQKTTLRQFGIGPTGLKTKGQASVVLSVVIRRVENHLATPGQMATLKELGVKDYQYKTTYWVKSYFHAIHYQSKLPDWVAEQKYGGRA